VPTDGSDKLATYLGKYMSKQLLDERLLAEKAYMYSRNCLRSVSLSGRSISDVAKEQLGVDNSMLQVVKEFDTLWLGRCVYKKYLKN